MRPQTLEYAVEAYDLAPNRQKFHLIAQYESIPQQPEQCQKTWNAGRPFTSPELLLLVITGAGVQIIARIPNPNLRRILYFRRTFLKSRF